ncbi:pseudouridine synthase [Emticicia sediminis]
MRNSDRPKKADNRGGFGEKKAFGDKPAFKKRENGVGGFGERKRIVTSNSESKTYSDRKPYNNDRPYQKREESSDRKPFGDKKPFSNDRPYQKREESSDRKPFGERKPFNSDRPYQKREESSDRKPFGERKPFSSDRPFQKREESSDRKPFGERKPFNSDRPYQKREESSDRKPFGERKPFSSDRPYQKREESSDRKPYVEGRDTSPKSFEDKPRTFSDERPAHPFKKRDDSGRPTSNDRKNAYSADKPRFQKNEPHNRDFKPKNKFEPKENQATSSRIEAPNYDLERLKSRLPEKVQKKVLKEEKESGKDDLIRLNRYISNAGIASRRDADELIASGQITVNGKEIKEMGYKVKPSDVVKYGKKILSREKLVYVLLNKPKDFITTTEDPDERRTVMDLVKNACPERIYPVGRLDRNTTGLLLLTNDGELAEKLSHPSNEVKKIYQVELDKPITTEDFESIINGIELEDGFIKPDELALVTPDAEVVGIKIHSGKNRIVRRIFEHLGYEVLKLDRTTYAGLDKKDLPRGKWRFLTEKEVIRLKYML